MKRFGIPLSYLTKVGIYDNITVVGMGGVKVVTANCEGVLEKHITDFINVVCREKIKVVGVDLKQVLLKGNKIKILVMFAGFHSLIMDMNYSQDISASFMKFAKDDSICFVAATDAVKNLTFIHSEYKLGMSYPVDNKFDIPCVLVGDLAVIVLKKAGLNKLSMPELGYLVGVSYDKKPSDSASEIIHLDFPNPIVFAAGKIVSIISDACACYQIGHKLLSFL